jgi:hypothetical protein
VILNLVILIPVIVLMKSGREKFTGIFAKSWLQTGAALICAVTVTRGSVVLFLTGIQKRKNKKSHLKKSCLQS